MKMNLTCVGAVGGLLVAGVASGGGFQSLTMELANSGNEGNTYRLFANLETGARINSVYGNGVSDLQISTANNASIYHNANGGPTSKEINSNFFPFVPSMEWDSYVSIGSYYQNGAPFGDNNLNNIGMDWATWEGGGDLFTNDGSWFVDSTDVQGAELNGQVFLGQFTVQGGLGDASDLIGQVNLQGEDAGGNTWNAIGVTWNTDSTDNDDNGGNSNGDTNGSNAVPGIGAIAPLCFVGLVRKRRRQG